MPLFYYIYVTEVLCTTVMGLSALSLTKHKKNTKIIRFQCLFIFDDFGMKTNFKLIFHKEQICRGDHSDSNECIFFCFLNINFKK